MTSHCNNLVNWYILHVLKKNLTLIVICETLFLSSPDLVKKKHRSHIYTNLMYEHHNFLNFD